MDIVVEGIDIYYLVIDKCDWKKCVYDLFEIVGLSKEYVNCYFYEFLGG